MEEDQALPLGEVCQPFKNQSQHTIAVSAILLTLVGEIQAYILTVGSPLCWTNFPGLLYVTSLQLLMMSTMCVQRMKS